VLGKLHRFHAKGEMKVLSKRDSYMKAWNTGCWTW